jgi:hypothetical protein
MAAIFVPNWSGEDVHENPQIVYEGEIRGLPARNFTIDELTLNMMSDRIVINRFTEVFGVSWFEDIDRIAIVKVEGEPQLIDGRDFWEGRASSTARVLVDIYGRGSEIVEITQSYSNYRMEGYNSILLRDGGVYILPLVKWEGKYGIVANMDVLFEIDDNGKIFSHSRNPAFNYFDGKCYTVLVDEINRMRSNEEYMTAVLNGLAFSLHTPLVEVFVTDEPFLQESAVNASTLFMDMVYPANVLRLINGYEFYGDKKRVTVPDSINFKATTEDIDYRLEKGGRYLVNLSYSDCHGGYIIPFYDFFYVNDNDVIRAGSFSSSEERRLSVYNGYTLDEFIQLNERLREFEESFARSEQIQTHVPVVTTVPIADSTEPPVSTTEPPIITEPPVIKRWLCGDSPWRNCWNKEETNDEICRGECCLGCQSVHLCIDHNDDYESCCDRNACDAETGLYCYRFCNTCGTKGCTDFFKLRIDFCTGGYCTTCQKHYNDANHDNCCRVPPCERQSCNGCCPSCFVEGCPGCCKNCGTVECLVDNDRRIQRQPDGSQYGCGTINPWSGVEFKFIPVVVSAVIAFVTLRKRRK